MRILSLSLAGLLLATAGYCQNLTISAKVLDRETKEPLPFASVGIMGKPIGTITNLQGEFDFHFPVEYRQETFVISMLGYTNYEAPLTELLNRPMMEILVDKSNTVLNTVIVSDSLQGGDILRAAISRIDQNYPNEPFLLEGFYRDVKQVAGTYISVLEAAIRIYDENYKEPRNKSKLRERVSLQEVRRSIGYANRFTTYFDQDNLLEVLLLNNDVRYRLFPKQEIFFSNLRREADSHYNGREIFVVSHSSDFHLKAFIDKQNFGIIHVEYENNIPEDLGRVRGLNHKFESMRRVVDFKFIEGKFFLNYLTIDYKVNWYDAETDMLKFETALRQELLINKVQAQPEERITVTQKMKGYGLQYQDLPYNKKFWDSYNMIKESPLDQKIIMDLELEGPLEKQFQKH